METILSLLEKTNEASLQMRLLSDGEKSEILLSLAKIIGQEEENILRENQKDVVKMEDANPKKDRLILNSERIQDLVSGLKSVANLPDPTNQVLSNQTLDNGLSIEKISVPLGVVGIIYESRPNVTIDVAALCIRSGNACVLRGGSDAFHSNLKLVSLIHQALAQHGVSKDAVQLLPIDRKFVKEMLEAKQFIDIIIPRGSQQLIDFVRENSKVPTIETGAGVCHTYVHTGADLNKAADIVVNAKVSRPSVCNALDTILVDEVVAESFLPTIIKGMNEYNVEIFADSAAYKILADNKYPKLEKADESAFGREFLDFKCSVKVVKNVDEALAHIRKHSSKHSEAIVSEDKHVCSRFLKEVDAASVYTNASTRFTDGGVFGLGAEIGISTQKLHARGPFALEKLTTEKWVIEGDGQIR